MANEQTTNETRFQKEEKNICIGNAQEHCSYQTLNIAKKIVFCIYIRQQIYNDGKAILGVKLLVIK